MDRESLRIIFMGTPEFAATSLRRLVESDYQIVGVITAPDKPAGRGQKNRESAVKTYAVANGLHVMQPVSLKDPSFHDELKALKPDLQIVVAFRMLPESVWSLPPMGTVNLHASLLPQYRGAAPIHWAVINGETKTGVSTFRLKHEIDTGDILAQDEVEIHPSMTTGELHDRLMDVGSELLIETIEMLRTEQVEPISQDRLVSDQCKLKPAPKINKSDAKIDWEMPAEQVHNLIRGMNPFPGAWTTLVHRENQQEKKLRIFGSQIADKDLSAGQINTDGNTYLIFGCGSSAVTIDEVQLEGKRRISTAEFLRGFQIDDYTINI